jgi:hypothetical protein
VRWIGCRILSGLSVIISRGWLTAPGSRETFARVLDAVDVKA